MILVLTQKGLNKSCLFIVCVFLLAAVWNNSLDFGSFYPSSTATAAGMGNVCSGDCMVPVHCVPVCVPLRLCK